jgi:UDP-N-acetylmuramate dehydrogenase
MASHLVTARDEATVVEALRFAQAEALPALILGGGSNIVVSDVGFAGLVIEMAQRGVELSLRGSVARVCAAAGEPWDALVAMTIERDLAGIECLSGIPGLVGATPIQNVGAYGQEVAQCISSVRVLDRKTLRVTEVDASDCGFAYRDSAFKREPERCVVLAVTFSLHLGGEPSVAYAELEHALRAHGSSPSLSEVRRTVLNLRRAKGMLLDPDGQPPHSAGSFFTNPIVSASAAEQLVLQALREGIVDRAEEVPRYATADGMVKLAAGWLIERAGFARGQRRGAVGISPLHALALVHHGGGTSAELLALASEIRSGVLARFSVDLTLEPVLVGVHAV